MSLIKCPECGKEISDKATSCPNCGFPIEDFLNNFDDTKICRSCKKPYTKIEREHIATGINGMWIFHEIAYCDNCKEKVDLDNLKSRKAYEQKEKISEANAKNISATVRAVSNVRNTIRCPYCGGVNCQAFVENKIIKPEKVKSRTTLNLNPLRPFTVFNHKQKVVRNAVVKDVSKFICNNCGKIFN